MSQLILQVRLVSPEQKNALEAFESVNINTDSVESVRLVLNKLFDQILSKLPPVDKNLKPVALENFVYKLQHMMTQTNNIDVKGLSRTDFDGHHHLYLSVIPKERTNGQ